MTTPNNVYTNCLNGTLITYDGNEFVLQNDLGNGRVEHAKLPSGYVPLGVREYGGIIYVVCANPITGLNQVGSFPSPERLISSEETEMPEIQITDSNFWNENNYPEDGFFSEYFKTGNITEDVLRPGDEFLIAFGVDNSYQTISELLQVLTHYTSIRDDNNEIIDWKKKRLVFNIRLGLITNDGTIQYIEDNLLKFSITEDAKHWCPFISGAPSQFISLFKSRYENKDLYNIYKENTSGNIVLIVELESIEEFTIQRSIIVEDADKSIFGVNFNCRSTNNQEDSEYYNEKVKLEGVEANFELYNNDKLIDNKQIRIRRPNQEVDLKFYLEEFKQDLEGYSDVLKYTIMPYSNYGKYPRHLKKGTIDFQYVNSGKHFLNEFRYYTGNNTSTISYGLDYYPKEGFSVNEVFFEFYDIANDYSIYHKCRDQEEYSGNFTETFDFTNDFNIVEISPSEDINNHYYIQRNRPSGTMYIAEDGEGRLLYNNLYLVRICISETDSDDRDPSKNIYTNYYRFLYTTSIFNENYLNNEVLDFETLKVTGELDADLESKLSITADTKEKLDYYKLYNNSSQVEEDNNLLGASKKSTYTIEDPLTVIPRLESENVGTTIKKYYGEFNPSSIEIDGTSSDTKVVDYQFTYEPELNGSDSTDVRIGMTNILDQEDNVDRLTKEPTLTADPLDKRKIVLNTEALLNRFIVANKRASNERMLIKLFQQYLSEDYVKTSSANNISKRVFGLEAVSYNNSEKLALTTGIAIKGATNRNEETRGIFYFADLLPEPFVDADDIVREDYKKDDDTYYYRKSLLVHKSSRVEGNTDDSLVNNPFNIGLNEILNVYNPYKPTLVPLHAFNSYFDLDPDGMIYYGDNMYPAFSKFYYQNNKGEKFSPTDRSYPSTILLAWKTTNIIPGHQGPQYVLVNFFGVRDYPYDGGILHDFSNRDYGNTVKNPTPYTKTFSEKITEVLSNLYLVQYDYNLFYLVYPDEYLYTIDKDDLIEIGISIKTNTTGQTLFLFDWLNRQTNSFERIPFNKGSIEAKLNTLNINITEFNKINFNNVDITADDFSLDKIEKILTYEFGDRINIEDLLVYFNSGKSTVLENVKEDIVYIDKDFNIITNPIDKQGNLIGYSTIYVKYNGEFYDLNETDLKKGRLFMDEKTQSEDQLFGGFTPPHNYKYNLDLYNNFKNVFIASYAMNGLQAGTLNEPLIRGEILNTVSESRSARRYKLWFWSGGQDGKENSWGRNSPAPSVMRNITFDPYYELIRPITNTAKPLNELE